MSHELRTPLNSLLILSDQLCKNQGGNLTNKQVEFAKTIHASGNDLLTLINDILDLSKIESGTVLIDPIDLTLEDLRRYVERTFRHVAEAKSVDFFIRLDPRLPKSMFADAKRLQQVLKNLLSNAFKFTHEGSVTLTMEPAESGWSSDNEELNRSPDVVAISVSDTGIGISSDKQQIIFEAFQQADGSTSRKYGGTGLGLAISRELSRLLGGEIRLASAPGSGSTFTLFLPMVYTASRTVRRPAPDGARGAETSRRPAGAIAYDTPALVPTPAPARIVNEVGDDRDSISLHDRVVLIVENDLAFARFVLDAAREKGFKGLVTSQGVAALALAAEYKPAAITLDIFLPDIEGWRVLERLKNDPQTRHIPVAVISTDESRERALSSGAFQFLTKPIHSKEELDGLLERVAAFVERPERSLLVVSPDAGRRDNLCAYLTADDVKVFSAGDYRVAAEMLAGHAVDCVVLDSTLPPPARGAIDGDTDLVASLASRPVVVYGQRRGRCRRGVGQLRAPWRGARSANARARARPRELLPAPHARQDARDAPRCAEAALRGRRRAQGPQRDGRGRRHAQHLRADLAARGPRHERHVARQRARRDHFPAGDAQRRRRADGHHDARDGRHRHDPRDPPDPRVP